MPVPRNLGVGLTLVVMKCLEQLVLAHTKDSVDITVDPQQYACRNNHSVSCSISCHSVCSDLSGGKGHICKAALPTFSAFSTITPQTLASELLLLGLKPSMCNWVFDFLTKTEDPWCLVLHHHTQRWLYAWVCIEYRTRG